MKLTAYSKIYYGQKSWRMRKWWWIMAAILIGIFFLPWTQNIKATGKVTTRNQESRPQILNSPIAGRIEKWYIKEGDWVKKGDTILILSEVKTEYLDPNLVKNAENQISAKRDALNYYKQKVNAAESQIQALEEGLHFKRQQNQIKQQQTENKLAAEQAEFVAVETELKLASDQLERQQQMYDKGLVSKTQFQQRQITFQNVQAKKISLENKISQTKQEIAQLEVERQSIEQDYYEKISKTQGEKFQNLSQISGGEGDILKMENQKVNYERRNGMYILTATQNGQIVQTSRAGIGEIIKDGDKITLIVPEKRELAVEIFVKPNDMPLLQVGQPIQMQFDGFPAVVFSGWPKQSIGVFPGKIAAIEHTLSDNGMYRVLVIENSTGKKWPTSVYLGAGVRGMALLKTVPVWYELWRNINGFPADYYKPIDNNKSKNEHEK